MIYGFFIFFVGVEGFERRRPTVPDPLFVMLMLFGF